MARLSVELERFLFEEPRQSRVTFAELLELAQERAFGVLFALISLPSALPVPAPGYSVPFGIALLLLAMQLAIGREKPWLPPRLAKGAIALETARKFAKSGTPWLKRFEAIARPRLTFLCTNRAGQALMGCAIALMSVSMMIPVPLTNTVPAMGIFITGVGLVEDDGAIALGGLIICALGAMLTTAVLLFGAEAVRQGIKLLLGAG
ncbi:putative ABC-type transport system, permease component [Rubidibacter lacunae KORDI 51-2]|uniref:Putative ABC-type transport system, permease component n=1 Tax=Rubidibacter lacunae KORDI 51-2 TaxID=582515 RepID=U5DEA1_9CHRO|nr:exopolysaccharide biosynthesis protein [Rubidibacter lacunae]ERN42843.1 putative ABC-type transport system, permease component [Rubidibacter lacunae KORDI 51-2]